MHSGLSHTCLLLAALALPLSAQEPDADGAAPSTSPAAPAPPAQVASPDAPAPPDSAEHPQPVDATEALWEKVLAARDALENPPKAPESREEAVTQFRSGITAFDDAYAAFVAAAPQDERRWAARLFAAKIANSRPLVDLEVTETLPEILSQILQANDVSAAVRSEASAALLIESANKAKETADGRKLWKDQVIRHLEKYPNEPLNRDLLAARELMEPLDLAFTDIEGQPFDLKNLRGKVVLLDFWATWCGPCIAELPSIRKAYEELHPQGFEIVGISLDHSVETLKGFVKANDIPWVQYNEGNGWENALAERFGITSIPAMWLLNKEGRVVDMHARYNLEAKVGQLLREEPQAEAPQDEAPAEPETSPSETEAPDAPNP